MKSKYCIANERKEELWLVSTLRDLSIQPNSTLLCIIEI